MTTLCREAWLKAFTDAAAPHFEEAGAPIPANVRCSIGFSSKGVRSNRIGECWADVVSQDAHFEIFIVPALQSDSSRIADILTHELVHAAVGLEAGHGPKFAKVAKALGLEGKMTATTAGARWHAWADPILEQLGPMPGASLGGSASSSAPKKQTTRMLKVECPDCGFSFRTTAKHLEAHDELTCPTACGGILEQAA
jgi:ribosomal protein S27E